MTSTPIQAFLAGPQQPPSSTQTGLCRPRDLESSMPAPLLEWPGTASLMTSVPTADSTYEWRPRSHLALCGEAPFQLPQHRGPHARGLRKENVLARVKASLLGCLKQSQTLKDKQDSVLWTGEEGEFQAGGSLHSPQAGKRGGSKDTWQAEQC